MIPLLWITGAYAFCRVLNSDSLAHVAAYGLLFCMAGALLAFADDVIRTNLLQTFNTWLLP